MNVLRQRIPTILGILILIAGITGGVYLVQKGGVWSLKADPGAVPKEIRITNISESGFTVSWATGKESLGYIKYGISSSLKETIVDERDKLSGKAVPYFVHHVKVEGLKPVTKYYFKIGSERGIYDNNGKPYEVTTAPVLGTPPSADTVYGTILKADSSSPAEGVVVYLTLANSVPLSVLTKSGGGWTIPLSVARTPNLSSYIIYDPDASIEEIFVQGGNLGTATAIVTTKNDSPVPTIILGKSHDFREVEMEEKSGFSLQPLISPPAVGEEGLRIVNPEEGEGIATQRPEIRGEGPKGVAIEITLESPESFTASVVVNEDGSWKWTPPADLSPGEHTVSVVSDNGSSVSRRFTVLAAEGDLPAFTATRSGEASPSPTLSPAPTTTPGVFPTATPSVVPTIASRKAMPATEEGVPEPGYLTPTIIFVILGIILIFTGLFLNFKLDF